MFGKSRAMTGFLCSRARWVVLFGVGVGVGVEVGAGATAAAATAAGPTSEAAGDTARPRGAPEISATGACPAADKIWTAMATLVPSGALDALPHSAAIDVSDLGDTYRVRLATNGVERVRVYRDLARDCAQRARFAAVFVVLTLMPPELLIDSPPKLPPPEPMAAPAPPLIAAPPPPVEAPPPPSRRLRLELTALGDAAPAVLSSPEMATAGGELRVAIGGGPLVALVAVGLQPGTDFTAGTVRAREQRIPLDAGARLHHARSWIDVGGEASLVAAIFRAEGLSPVVARQATRIDLGLRAGVTLRVGPRNARVAPIAGVHGLYFPRPYDLATIPGGVAGRTPTFRIGATAGLAASF
jgi:hypothetical protein